MGESRNVLPIGFKIHWYVIKNVLGQGGFGITYLAEDTNLNQHVAIKEYLPAEMAFRENNHSVQPLSGEHGDNFQWGLDRFINEAQTLAKFKHDNIVRVYSVFTENNTAYMVMDFENGIGLDKRLKQEKTLQEEDLKQILFPLLDGLENIHNAGFIHRDIKPPNIYIRENSTPVLLDFGSARQSLGIQTRTLTTLVSPGYAPFEQYVSKSDKQGPWTDIYGLSATLYRAITGKSPPNAVDRSEALLHTGKDIYVPASQICSNDYSKAFLDAVDHGMGFKTDDRPVDIKQWRREFKGEIARDSKGVETSGKPSDSFVEASAANEQTVKITMPVPDVQSETATEVIDKSVKPVRKRVFTKKRIAIVVIILIIIANRQENQLETQQAPEVATANVTDINPVELSDSPVPVDEKAGVETQVDRPPVSDRVGNSDQKNANQILPARDRRRLATLREKWRNSGNTKETEQEIRKITNEFNLKVKEAIREGNRPLAEAYIKEALKLAPNNKRLLEALEKL